MEQSPGYTGWSKENLITRIEQLENDLKIKGTISSNTTSSSTSNSIPSSILSPVPAVAPAVEPTHITKSGGRQKSSVPKQDSTPRIYRPFDPEKYHTRLIGLKFAYLGKRYNGFEYHANTTTPLPTVEEEVWKALMKSRLIFPTGGDPSKPDQINWEGCDYSKCGRTDKGVSAFGQVIGIRVRSNRPKGKKSTKDEENGVIEAKDTAKIENVDSSITPDPALADMPLLDEEDLKSDEFDPIADEIQYPALLNHQLPADIRVTAWCPSPPADFSARFSCRERQYRYFFTQPAFLPIPRNLEAQDEAKTGMPKAGWLDIEAMRDAAKRFEGLHDFRNFCKVDASKQITNYLRRIYLSDIVEVEDSASPLRFVGQEGFLPKELKQTIGSPKVYTFNLHGSAFLWHQVRHMVAILFLVGQGLEKPSIVDKLMDIELTPQKPKYEMASDTPLVLWDCIFPHPDDEERKDYLDWEYVGDGPGMAEYKYGTPGLMDDLWAVWRDRKIDEILAGSLIDSVSRQGKAVQDLTTKQQHSGVVKRGARSQKVFDGADKALMRGDYVPVMKRARSESVAIVNERYASKRGFTSSEQMKAAEFQSREVRRAAFREQHGDVSE